MVRAWRPRPPPPPPHSWVQADATLATTIAVLGCWAAVLLPCIAAAPASTVAGAAAAAPPPSPGAAVPGGTVLRLQRQMHRPGAGPSPPTAADSSEASVTATRRTADKIYSRHLDHAIATGSSSSSRITISPGVAAPPIELDAGGSSGTSHGGGRRGGDARQQHCCAAPQHRDRGGQLQIRGSLHPVVGRRRPRSPGPHHPRGACCSSAWCTKIGPQGVRPVAEVCRGWPGIQRTAVSAHVPPFKE